MASATRDVHEKDLTLGNGLTLHYYEWPGPRPNLILLHPSSGYGRMWEWTANALGRHFHVYALDQRGHGDSGRPDGDYSAEEYAQDLYLFFKQVGIDKAIVAGQSLGGRVGMVFAATHPEMTDALGLVGGPHMSNFFPTRQATINVLGAAQRMLESKTEFPSREAALDYLKAQRRRDREDSLRHRLEHNTKASGSGVAVKYDNVRVAIGLAHMADDLRKYASKTTCPVAILRGSSGAELSLEDAKAVAPCWKHAVVIDVEGDYALQMENPAGLAEALISFAAQHVKS
jgi:2-(acetamidomethylene)succinate hydrolase